ncbi:hypothetical protein [Aromatoleum diolicum]|nr:hypothetical protein [Aromatoleum diolicum]
MFVIAIFCRIRVVCVLAVLMLRDGTVVEFGKTLAEHESGS